MDGVDGESASLVLVRSCWISRWVSYFLDLATFCEASFVDLHSVYVLVDLSSVNGRKRHI